MKEYVIQEGNPNPNPMLSQIFTGQLLIYMIAKFQWMGCEHLVAKAKIVNDKTKENEAYRCVGHRTAPDFRADMRAAVDAIRPLYAQILIKCSDYSNTHKDRLFFEAFYATLGYTPTTFPTLISELIS